MIDIKTIKESDIGKGVEYKPYETYEADLGIITSYNATYIFVKYENVFQPKATNPEDLNFI